MLSWEEASAFFCQFLGYSNNVSLPTYSALQAQSIVYKN